MPNNRFGRDAEQLVEGLMERWTTGAYPLQPMVSAMMSTAVAHLIQAEGRRAAAALLRRLADAIEQRDAETA
jgi:hypothetical protein